MRLTCGCFSACLNGCVLQVLVGIVTEESASEAVLELLLSHLVPPKSQENPLACQYVCARGQRQQSGCQRRAWRKHTPPALCHQPVLPFVVPSRAVFKTPWCLLWLCWRAGWHRLC